jgi:hypothetical protein
VMSSVNHVLTPEQGRLRDREEVRTLELERAPQRTTST